MKKVFKIIFIVIISILILFAIILFIDLARIKNNQVPWIATSKKEGNHYIYNGIGYKVWRCQEKTGKYVNYIGSKDLKYTCSSYEPVYTDIKIIDESKNCLEALELIYSDRNNRYYLPCVKSSMIYVVLNETGEKIKIKQALEMNKVTIKDLEHAGLKIITKKR